LNGIVSIIGSSGIGKTTFAEALSKRLNLPLGLESHDERPYQKRFADTGKPAFHNQVDYLLFRWEQEIVLRKNNSLSIVDGGLDMDFHGFVRLFYRRSLLDDDEYNVLERLYSSIRKCLSEPDLIVFLRADPATVAARLAGRSRINIARAEDSVTLDESLMQWVAGLEQDKVTVFDVSASGKDFSREIEKVIEKMEQLGLQ
jgi:deoxyadenosine/deoxycytidine kinase